MDKSESTKDRKSKLKSRIEAIKKLYDEGLTIKKTIDKKTNVNSDDSFLKDLPTTEKLFGKKLSDYTEKRKKNRENNKNIFSELVDFSDSFLGAPTGTQTDGKTDVQPDKKLTNKEKLKKITLLSLKKTLESTPQIIINNVLNFLFINKGVCGTSTIIPHNSIQLSPKEFDFLNLLTMSPNSNSGKLIYELQTTSSGLIKMNREFYNNFNNSGYDFTTKDGETLFNMSWDDNNQTYDITNLKNTLNPITLYDFILEYYTNIEFLDISGVTKTAMLMTLNGNAYDTPLFDLGLNFLDRLLNKLCSICGKSNNNSTQTPNSEFNENDVDVESYFDFDDPEGIDTDKENQRLKKTLNFKDCNNYETNVNPDHLEDFSYFSNKKNLNDLLSDTLQNVAADVFENSGNSESLEKFHISLINSFIQNIPNALIGLVLSPKYIFPIVLTYKIINQEYNEIKVLMKKLNKLLYAIIREIFWVFITKFWELLKIELINFLEIIGLAILKEKIKRYKIIISTLIKFIRGLLNKSIKSCDDLYDFIGNSIDLALNKNLTNVRIPNLLLTLSDKKGGYSANRAFINIIDLLKKDGVNVDNIYGEKNKLVSSIYSILKGHDDEMLAHSYVTSSNKAFIIQPADGAPIFVPPGTISISGDLV